MTPPASCRLRRRPGDLTPGTGSVERVRTPNRKRGRLVALAWGLGVPLVAAVGVRLALDWSDSMPYEGAVTEQRYIVIACLAVACVVASTVVAVLLWRRAGRAEEDR